MLHPLSPVFTVCSQEKQGEKLPDPIRKKGNSRKQHFPIQEFLASLSTPYFLLILALHSRRCYIIPR